MENSEIRKKLYSILDKRRGNGNVEMLKYVVPDLVFLFAITKKYEKEKKIAFDPNDPIYYEAIKLPVKSNWNYILKEIKSNQQKVKDILYEALDEVEKCEIYGKKDGLKNLTYKDHFLDYYLTDIDLLNIIEEFDEEFQKHVWERDYLGTAYQFFLEYFAKRSGKTGGEFYTPSSVVQLLVSLLQPFPQQDYETIIYDPCCGSGGMFVQCKSFIEKNKRNKKLVCVGQEINSDAFKLAKKRLIIEGLVEQIKWGDTLAEDKNPNVAADFILTNPPFNQKYKDLNESRDKKDNAYDKRWEKYGMPSDGNHAWLSHVIYKLKEEGGVGAVIMANITLTSLKKNDIEMRKKWVNNGLVETIITLPNKLFYTTPIAPCIWILRKGRKINEILMIDVSQDYFGEKISGGERILEPQHIDKIVHVYQEFHKEGKINETNFPARIVSQSEIQGNNFLLFPSRYLTFNIENLTPAEIDKELLTITKQLEELITEQDKYHHELRKLLKEIEKEVKND